MRSEKKWVRRNNLNETDLIESAEETIEESELTQ